MLIIEAIRAARSEYVRVLDSRTKRGVPLGVSLPEALDHAEIAAMGVIGADEEVLPLKIAVLVAAAHTVFTL